MSTEAFIECRLFYLLLTPFYEVKQKAIKIKTDYLLIYAHRFSGFKAKNQNTKTKHIIVD